MVAFALRQELPREINPHFLLNEYGDYFFNLLSFSRINSTWFITRLANQSARKKLFTCVLNTLGLLHQQKAHWHFELETLD